MESQREICGSILGLLQGLMGSWRALIAKHTAGTVVLVRNGDRAPRYTWIVNNVYSDGPKLVIERGRYGICRLQTTYALTDRE